MSTTFFGSGQAEENYIRQTAASYGLDPEAVLAVAAHEGVTLPSEVGDWSGETGSYGPWQMRDPRLPGGGALPLQIAQQGPAAAEQWANSQAGINYALASIAKAAGGATGPTAVGDIVYGFEHPADPTGETQAATQTYQQGGGPGSQQQWEQWLFNNPGIAAAIGAHGANPLYDIPIVGGPATSAYNKAASVVSQAGQVPGEISSGISSIGSGISFVTSWRFAEIVGGVLLLIIGLVIFAKSMGLVRGVPGANLVPGTAGPPATTSVPTTFSNSNSRANRRVARYYAEEEE